MFQQLGNANPCPFGSVMAFDTQVDIEIKRAARSTSKAMLESTRTAVLIRKTSREAQRVSCSKQASAISSSRTVRSTLFTHLRPLPWRAPCGRSLLIPSHVFP
jgi:hypothetical protein